jgi:hypothetical protein
MKEILKEIQNDMDDFFAEIDKAFGIEPEPICGLDELVEKLADKEADYWEMKAEVHFGI